MKREPEDHLTRQKYKSSSQVDAIHDSAEKGGMYNASIASGGCDSGSDPLRLIGPKCYNCKQMGVQNPGDWCGMCVRLGLEPDRPVSMTYREKALEELGKPVVWVHRNGTHVTYEIHNVPTQEAGEILEHILPNVLELFLKKNKDYGDSTYGDNAMRLGPRAQFVDIWRKVKKLKRAIWDGEDLTGEQPDEIFSDFIGHCLLAKLDYRRDRG